ncbi:MAG: hypothetical protein OEZ38_01370 [Gammaproteobacteria bacterium]|nr:hypothetical protein [Gammaproteobacteria bacterium]
MKTKTLYSYILMMAVAMGASVAQAADKYLPFSLGSESAGSIADQLAPTKAALEANGFVIAGEYSPYDGAHIVVVTNDELKAAAKGNRGGYIAAQRVSLTEMAGKVQVSYTNPFYMAKAYRIASELKATSAALQTALGHVKDFGPDEGLTVKKLGKYHYTFGMEYFDEPLSLANAGSRDALVNTIEKNLAANKGGASKVYRIDIPGTTQTLFGIGMKAPNEGKKYMDEGFIMSEIDFKPTRSTAHLPYEILVNGNEAEALHARFRIAINFPDLSMMGDNSFMNIMSTPDAIRDVLTNVAGGQVSDSDF